MLSCSGCARSGGWLTPDLAQDLFNVFDLPPSKGFVTVTPASVQLSALREKAGRQLEIRVVEVEGRPSPVSVELGFPVADACATDLRKVKVADVSRTGNRLQFTTEPWKIHTFEVCV
jgi:hypothetical protein